ncbi:MAG TPA: M1 family metallopeptidase [Puia sp.]|nr:M1 family metallopeptidase [Puia sp.]
MKRAIGYLLLLCVFRSAAQIPSADSLLLGEYHVGKGLNVTFKIYGDNKRLMLEIVGQGATPLSELSPLVFQPEHVRPKATITFLRDSTGEITGLRWLQTSQFFTWKRIGGDPGNYSGDYRLVINPYRILYVSERDGKLMGHIAEGQDTVLSAAGKNRFRLKIGEAAYTVVFKRDKQGLVHEVITSGEDIVLFEKKSSTPGRISNRINGFTRADSLQGMLTPLRSCYDVLFYDLDLTILPETKSIRGSNTIRFRAVGDFDRLQVDLHKNLSIDKILYHGHALSYTREENAVFVRFPEALKAGSIDSFRVQYSGTPLEPDLTIVQGGVFWLWDKNKNLWIASVVQGVGANVFWPCKEHLSDRPDSMRISVTIPTGLEEISNGRLLQRTNLPDGQTRFVWYVDYPIVTYDVAINIGDYIHFTDVYTSGGDSLRLNFYSLSYNSAYAHWLFGDIKRMLALYEKDFGPYPFRRDGFNIMESIYPMEHQGAVSMGMMGHPVGNTTVFDTAGDLREMWHESSHEWWGNSVGNADFADMWLHEGFATYAEFLNEESLYGRDSALRELTNGHPDNKEPIIGVYNVNHFHMGDMYLKGALILETLRNLTGNDSLWFSIFRGIQRQFKYQPVSSKEIENYFSHATGTDYSYFFEQYLRHAAIPSLILHLETHGPNLEVRYRWEADVPDFRMPIKVTVARDSLGFIYPTPDWQTIELKGITTTDFRVDTTEFYAAVKVE